MNLWADSPVVFYNLIQQALQNVVELAPLLYPALFNWSDSMSHRLVLIDREDSCDLRGDTYVIRIKTEAIRAQLWRRSLEMSMESALDFFRMTGGQTRTIAGVAFEGIALRCISGHFPTPARSAMMREFRRMTRVATSGDKFPHAFEYTPDARTTNLTLVLSDEGMSLRPESLPTVRIIRFPHPMAT